MNKKNAGPAKANHKKDTKHDEGHKPWALETQTEGLDELQGDGSSVKAESAKAESAKGGSPKGEKGEKEKKAAECGCKYF